MTAAALPAYSPPERFWQGLAERRRAHGFLICFDEVVTGIGRVGSWLAAHQLPIEPDIVAVGKGLGAGLRAARRGSWSGEEVYEAIDRGSREFDLGHTWDGAPLPSAVGLAVLDQIDERGLVERVRERGPALRDELAVGDRGFGARQGGPRAAGSSWASSSSTRATACRSCRSSSTPRSSSTTPRSSTACS